MKKISLIFILSIFLSCNQKNKSITPEFSEDDAYEVVNKHLFILSYNYDSLVYVNSRQLESIKLKFTKLEPETYLNSIDSIPLRPLFVKKYWKKEKVKKVIFIEWDKYCSILSEDFPMDKKKSWEINFNNQYIHNLAYPVYDSKKKTAVVRDYSYHPFRICGTGLDNLYYYKKTKNGWEQIDPFY